jgi:molecular chaperone HscB
MTSSQRPALDPVDPRATPFQRLGFDAPRFVIDDKVLERAWLDRSRKVHPDRFVGRPDAERRLAAEHTVALNDAYRALKDPYDRALWLVRRAGADAAALDSRLLVELMELREQAEDGEDARAAVVKRARERFAALAAGVHKRLAQLDGVAGSYDAASEPLRQVARSLAEMKTLARLVEDLDGKSGARLISTLDER